jgi:uncharacterized protein
MKENRTNLESGDGFAKENVTMRTDDFRPSENVEDDREASASRGGLPAGAGGLGIGRVIATGLISWYVGIDPSVLLNGAQIFTGGGSASQQTSAAPPVTAGTPNDPTGKFVALVLGDTEDRWTEIFAAAGKTYHTPRLRLFTGVEQSACGRAQSAMGPFYCPRDQRIYLDTSFFDDLQDKFGGCSSSDACKFSEAYVIAHEVGHHVQGELGILHRVMQAQQASAATSIRRCGRRPQSATTACRNRRRVMSCRTPSPTARRSSASAGS